MAATFPLGVIPHTGVENDVVVRSHLGQSQGKINGRFLSIPTAYGLGGRGKNNRPPVSVLPDIALIPDILVGPAFPTVTRTFPVVGELQSAWIITG
jgi:hypothetical protein